MTSLPIREKANANQIRTQTEKIEKLQDELLNLRSIYDKTKQDLDSRWSKKEQENRETRLKSAIESAKLSKAANLEAEKNKNLALSENSNLKERINILNNQIARQKLLIDDNKSRFVNEKSKFEDLSKKVQSLESTIEQNNLDLSHKKTHILNLKRQVQLVKEKFLKEEEVAKQTKADLVKISAEKVCLQERVIDVKKKLNLVEKTAEKSILNLLVRLDFFTDPMSRKFKNLKTGPKPEKNYKFLNLASF